MEEKQNKRKSNNENKKATYTYVAIAILIYLLTTMLAAQVKVISQTEGVIQNKRLEELQTLYTSLKAEYDDLKRYSETQQKVVDEYKNNASNNSTLISTLTEENKTYAGLAGAIDLRGQGITVTVDDSKKNTSDGYEASTLVVHDVDILSIVNELKAAGAEAISINDHRVITTTAIRCVGPVISVNGNRIAAPFVIKAIGDAQYLESAINLKGGVADTLKSTYGIQIDVKREKNIVIKKFSETLKFKYATEYVEE